MTPLVRSYTGATPADAEEAYRLDAAEAARAGYRPVAQRWEDYALVVTYLKSDTKRRNAQALAVAAGVLGLLAVVSIARPTDQGASVRPTRERPATPRTYATLVDRDWQKLLKDPDAYAGDGYKVWACVTQFDSATGPSTFRAQAANRSLSSWYVDGANAIFRGGEAQLADVVQGDAVIVLASVAGATAYDTTIGGSTTVPTFEVDAINRVGSCGL